MKTITMTVTHTWHFGLTIDPSVSMDQQQKAIEMLKAEWAKKVETQPPNEKTETLTTKD